MSDRGLHEMLFNDYMEEPTGLTVRECVAKSIGDYESGFEAHEVIDTFKPTSYKHCENSISNADKLIDYWRNHFVNRKFQGYDTNTSWQQGVVELITNTDQIARNNQIKLIATLPLYTSVQRKWDDYSTHFSSADKEDIDDFPQTYRVNLRLYDTYFHKTKHTVRTKKYIFQCTDNNYLYLFTAQIKDDSQKVFLDTLLKYTNNNIQCEVLAVPKVLDLNFKYLNIKYFQEIS
jgi:hypothetical protein